MVTFRYPVLCLKHVPCHTDAASTVRDSTEQISVSSFDDMPVGDEVLYVVREAVMKVESTECDATCQVAWCQASFNGFQHPALKQIQIPAWLHVLSCTNMHDSRFSVIDKGDPGNSGFKRLDSRITVIVNPP